MRGGQDFYIPEDLRLFLDNLQTRRMDTATPLQPQSLTMATATRSLQDSARERPERNATDFLPRVRDLERLSKNYDNRGQVLHAVAMHTQVADRDKSRSPLHGSHLKAEASDE
ncbi:hypothetical protein NDU88_005079 [Pleurodeles waltl]|uniref:Uncharacterized protein n=1 Tax=Pleurodeles waltl TaxID=8319 RepID=A0AAV7PLL9_PLEWA|nr:hypothetical protein NDU88_005079 [Pleurodeles waltl]